MRKLLFLLLLPSFIFSEEKSISLNLSCVVTEQTLIESVDGVSKKYVNYKDGLKNGESFLIEIDHGFFTSINSYSLVISQKDLYVLSYMKSSESIQGRVDSISYKRNGTGCESYLSENSFNVCGSFAKMSAKRYFKNDWHIMVSGNAFVGQTAHVLVANCMNMSKKWDKIISQIKEYEKEKWVDGL